MIKALPGPATMTTTIHLFHIIKKMSFQFQNQENRIYIKEKQSPDRVPTRWKSKPTLLLWFSGKTKNPKNQYAEIPGPGNYEANGLFVLKKRIPNIKFGKAEWFFKNDCVLGPGHYQTVLSSLSQMGGALKKANHGVDANDANPGPGDYRMSESLVKYFKGVNSTDKESLLTIARVFLVLAPTCSRLQN